MVIDGKKYYFCGKSEWSGINNYVYLFIHKKEKKRVEINHKIKFIDDKTGVLFFFDLQKDTITPSHSAYKKFDKDIIDNRLKELIEISHCKQNIKFGDRFFYRPIQKHTQFAKKEVVVVKGGFCWGDEVIIADVNNLRKTRTVSRKTFIKESVPIIEVS